MGSDGTHDKKIKSTQTAFDIVETVAERDHPRISEIADDVDHSRSTVHYHLKTLRDNGYVVDDGRGFRLGLRMAWLGDQARGTHRLTGVVEQPTDELADETGAVGHVAVPEGNRVAWLYRSPQDDADALPTAVGARTYLHATAYGQAILAYAPSVVLDDLGDDVGLAAVTERTLTDRTALAERLATVRELGFAYSAQEYEEGVSSVAAPIIEEATGEAVGAIGITAPHDRIEDPYKHTKARRFIDDVPRLVQQAARLASETLDQS